MEKQGMLANQIRPQQLSDVVGQEHLVGPDGIIYKMIEQDKLMSMILYGNAGCGKTTIARIIINLLKSDYVEINATNSNKKDLENAVLRAKMSDNFVLVIDEIHRLNKDKQDILLPHIESGLIKLIGLTNSNPYHSINTALRSRVILLEVKPISDEAMTKFLTGVIAQTDIKNYKQLPQLLEGVVRIANKDIRYAINQVELLSLVYDETKDYHELLHYLNSNIRYDKNESNYYDVISALQKSIRGSDVNAALFYLAILILSGDLDIIERRLTVCAYEDVGLANPDVVDRTMQALKAARMVGFPEAKIPLAFCVVDLALASKSNKAYEAIASAMDCVEKSTYTFNEYMRATPKDIKQKEMYWNVPYENRHLIQYLPDEVRGQRFYYPIGKSTYEAHLAQINEYLNRIERTDDLESLLKKIKK